MAGLTPTTGSAIHFFDNSKYSDIYLKIDTTCIHGHKVILEQHSGFFKTLFQREMDVCDETELLKAGYYPATFIVIVKYIYTGRIDMSDVHNDMHVLCQVFTAGEDYQIPNLEAAAVEQMIGVIRGEWYDGNHDNIFACMADFPESKMCKYQAALEEACCDNLMALSRIHTFPIYLADRPWFGLGVFQRAMAKQSEYDEMEPENSEAS